MERNLLCARFSTWVWGRNNVGLSHWGRGSLASFPLSYSLFLFGVLKTWFIMRDMRNVYQHRSLCRSLTFEIIEDKYCKGPKLRDKQARNKAIYLLLQQISNINHSHTLSQIVQITFVPRELGLWYPKVPIAWPPRCLSLRYRCLRRALADRAMWPAYHQPCARKRRWPSRKITEPLSRFPWMLTSILFKASQNER